MRLLRWLPLSVTLALLGGASPALANGRFPAAGQIAVDPADPAHVVVRATFGVVVTRDGGATWSWICEEAIGFSGVEDPAMGVTQDGSILAGILAGLGVTHDGGCQWGFAAGGGLAGRHAVDVSVERQNPASALVIVSQGDASRSQLWQSSDDARTWLQAGVDLPEGFTALTVDSTPGDPKRVYVSGHAGSPQDTGSLQRSDDRGQTWKELVIPGSSGAALPYIGGVDPKDPERLYVRLDGEAGDELLVSSDGGETWSEVFTTDGSLLGFALSPDGSTVALGVSKAADPAAKGVWTAPADTLQFQKVSSVEVGCLTWTAEGLYACGEELVYGFTVGLSEDGGKTFSPRMHLYDPCGPLACDPASSTGNVCPKLWPATRSRIGSTCSTGPGSSGSSASSTSSASSSGVAGGAGGCACDLPGGPQALPGPALIALAALANVVRAARSRKRQGVTPRNARTSPTS